MKILTDVLDVMTDGFHKSGIDAQAKIFYILVHVTTQNVVFINFNSGYRLHCGKQTTGAIKLIISISILGG